MSILTLNKAKCHDLHTMELNNFYRLFQGFKSNDEHDEGRNKKLIKKLNLNEITEKI